MNNQNQLETVDKNEVEIFRVGTWNGDRYTREDLQGMVEAFDKVGFEPFIKAGHETDQEDPKVANRLFGEPALGYVKALRVVGDRLVADLKDIPKRFANLINAGAFKRISAEIYLNWKDEFSGKTYPRVLKAIAFVGANVPALTNLREIESLYQLNDEKVKVYSYEKKEDTMKNRQFGDAERELTALARVYERQGATKREAFFRVFRENPELARRYEISVRRGRRVSVTESSFRLDEQVRKYMHQSGEGDYKTALKHVIDEDTRHYEESKPRAVTPLQQLGALVAPLLSRGDMDGAIAVASQDRRLAIEAASQWLNERADEMARNSTGTQSAGRLDSLRDLQHEYLEVAQMWSTGSVSEAAIKTMFS